MSSIKGLLGWAAAVGLTGLSGCSGQCLDDGFAWNQSKEACEAVTASESQTESDSASESQSASESTPTDSNSNSNSNSNTNTDSNSGTDSMSATDSASDTDSATVTDSASDTDSATVTDSATDSASATDTDTGDPGVWCADADGDGFGDPEMCVPGVPGEDPPPGQVPNDDDCDDTSATTFPGAAELDDPTACMKDEDDDGYGDTMPDPRKPDILPGSDCDDLEASTFPGAAPNDDPEACMKDADGDDWGDDMPMSPGVDPGTDCDDDDVFTFPGAAEDENADACMKDEDDDGWGDTQVDPGVDVGSDCYDTNADLNPGDRVLFTSIDNSGDVASVDVMNGDVDVFATNDIGPLNGGYAVISNAVSPIDGTIYGSQNAKQLLVTYNYCSGDTPVELMPHMRSVCGIAFDPQGNLYGVDQGNDEIVTFDAMTGEVLGAVPLTVDGDDVNIAGCGMAYDCVNGRLLVTDGAQSRILSVDAATGEGTVVANIPEGQWSAVSLEYDPVTKRAYTGNGDEIFDVALDGSNDYTPVPMLSESINDLTYGPTCN